MAGDTENMHIIFYVLAFYALVFITGAIHRFCPSIWICHRRSKLSDSPLSGDRQNRCTNRKKPFSIKKTWKFGRFARGTCDEWRIIFFCVQSEPDYFCGKTTLVWQKMDSNTCSTHSSLNEIASVNRTMWLIFLVTSEATHIDYVRQKWRMFIIFSITLSVGRDLIWMSRLTHINCKKESFGICYGVLFQFTKCFSFLYYFEWIDIHCEIAFVLVNTRMRHQELMANQNER